MSVNAEQARGKALAAMERTERNFKIALYGTGALEVAVLAALLLATDFSDRTHVMLLAGFVGSYSLIVLAVIALGVHVSRVGRRVLRALELRDGI